MRDPGSESNGREVNGPVHVDVQGELFQIRGYLVLLVPVFPCTLDEQLIGRHFVPGSPAVSKVPDAGELILPEATDAFQPCRSALSGRKLFRARLRKRVEYILQRPPAAHTAVAIRAAKSSPVTPGRVLVPIVCPCYRPIITSRCSAVPRREVESHAVNDRAGRVWGIRSVSRRRE